MTLVEVLEKEKKTFTYEVSDSKWKCKIQQPAEEINMKIKLFEVHQDKICVDFTRLSGSSLKFNDVYLQLYDKLKHHNDLVY